ncbi:uncharacterized protein LY79DRAFT_589513 [Colletotrichum navitas]|uniref:Amidohydrolase-related domain-containing protein n=1 Tax=Colletotrichum navitas TaxID=681940 RepID=A0AAD8V4A2_9PEZI|nr:uncharacterized protein LY79DRAFT_589513 [Colletotrichum navitas]KAK1593747.1 hypothetical protein LY79DRAFT_589513 [Colletotrichum navitas]
MNKILLKNGVLLVHGDDGKVTPTRSDLMIEGDQITQIDNNIEADTNEVKVFDCEEEIVSPGFISTRHHVWQTALKGRHVNHTLLEELGGALESIDGGITTVVDHSTPTMLEAFTTSGIRAVVISSWSPLTAHDDYASSSGHESWKSLAAKDPYGDGRIQLGFVVDNVYQSADEMKKLYSELRAAKAKVITSHSETGLPFGDGPSVVQLLNSHGLLGSDILISHANFPKDDNAELIAEHDVYISSTPITEPQLGWPPVGLLPEFEAHSNLGVDCHSFGSSFMPSQIRLGLQYVRTERQETLRR